MTSSSYLPHRPHEIYCPLRSGNITVVGIKALKQNCPSKWSIFHWKSPRTKTRVPYIEIKMYYSWGLEKRKAALKTCIWITPLHLYSSWRLFLPLFKKCFTLHKETARFWWMGSFQSKYKSPSTVCTLSARAHKETRSEPATRRTAVSLEQPRGLSALRSTCSAVRPPAHTSSVQHSKSNAL